MSEPIASRSRTSHEFFFLQRRREFKMRVTGEEVKKKSKLTFYYESGDNHVKLAISFKLLSPKDHARLINFFISCSYKKAPRKLKAQILYT
jgi:hypothetical protein